MTARKLPVALLTAEAFGPFGSVIEAGLGEMRLINGGTTERHHALAAVDVDEEGRAIISLFRGLARGFPFEITMMERHPSGSQAFYPLSSREWLVAVAPDDAGRPGEPVVFLARGDQGVSYGRNVWHHPLMALGHTSDFLVVDRDGPGSNLEEYAYPSPYVIDDPL